MTLINKYRGISIYGTIKEETNCDKKRTVYLKRLTNKTKVDRNKKALKQARSLVVIVGKIR